MSEPGAALRAALEALPEASRVAFGLAFGARAAAYGLTYTSDAGEKPIPVAFPPVIEPRARTEARGRLARTITGALVKTARAVLDGARGPVIRAELLDELAPLERPIVEGTYASLDVLATVRVDMFRTASGLDRVLELNATIPAMQGYSDIAARAFLEVALEQLAKLPESEARALAEAATRQSGSNAADLLASLRACFRARGGSHDHPRILLVHRDGDAQLGELRYLARHFTAEGCEARCATARSVRLVDGAVEVDGFRPELIYRHVFARRVEPDWPMAEVLRDPVKHRLVNPVDPQLEQKGMLGELSAAAQDPAIAASFGLSEDEIQAVARHVPWTRRLVPGAVRLVDGRELSDLVAWVRAHAADVVVKRSWDFGGKGVFLGAEHGDESSTTRTTERFGRALSWPELVDACAAERGWVVQERVPLPSVPLFIVAGGEVLSREVFVDLSAYTSFGTTAVPAGGVCRASGSPIVNIQSGGGVTPLISAEAIATIEARLPGEG